MVRHTYVVEFAEGTPEPRVGADTEILGGRLVAVQFADALREIELLRAHAGEEALAKVDAALLCRQA